MPWRASPTGPVWAQNRLRAPFAAFGGTVSYLGAFKHDAMVLEGIVSKRAAGGYRSGPSKSWLKTKYMTESEFVLVGMERNEGGPPFALLAREDGGVLSYCGSAFVTLPQLARDEFWSRAEALKIDGPVIAELRKGRRKASFVRPELRVRARHLRGGDMLRHATLTEVLT